MLSGTGVRLGQTLCRMRGARGVCCLLLVFVYSFGWMVTLAVDVLESSVGVCVELVGVLI